MRAATGTNCETGRRGQSYMFSLFSSQGFWSYLLRWKACLSSLTWFMTDDCWYCMKRHCQDASADLALDPCLFVWSQKCRCSARDNLHVQNTWSCTTIWDDFQESVYNFLLCPPFTPLGPKHYWELGYHAVKKNIFFKWASFLTPLTSKFQKSEDEVHGSVKEPLIVPST